jgi:hypothetical protein
MISPHDTIEERARKAGLSVAEYLAAEANVDASAPAGLARTGTLDTIEERARKSGMTVEERRRAEQNVDRNA